MEKIIRSGYKNSGIRAVGITVGYEIMNMGYEHIKEPREFLTIAFERAKRLEGFR